MSIAAASSAGTVDAVKAIHSRIQERTRGRVNPLRVELCGGRVLVRGLARSYYEKQLVIQAVLELTHMNPALPIAMDIKVLERERRP